MTTGKPYWREKIKIILGGFSSSEIQSKSEAISKKIQNLLIELVTSRIKLPHKKIVIGGYYPLKFEVIWHLKLMDFEDQFSFPNSMDGQSMNFYKTPLNRLVLSKKFGVSLPTPDESAEKVIPDVILVPGLGFSKSGQRLGRGKGFYDKYLENFKGMKWGICFNEQLFTDLPIERHDQKVDLVITDKEVVHVQNPIWSCR